MAWWKRRKEPLPDISRQLQESHQSIDTTVDNSDEQAWERENPGKVAATENIFKQSGVPTQRPNVR
jgi:hypothetical protein